MSERLSITAEEIERLAMRGDQLPDGYTQPQELLFLSFRALYREYRGHSITREQAKKEKAQIIRSYEQAQFMWEVFADTARLRNRMSTKLIQLHRDGCEYCKELIEIFDGMR